MSKQLELSIITVNYNGIKDTSELLESLLKQVSIAFEVIVVDNASKVNEAELLKEKYPWITAVRSERNLGFSGGNNLGIKEAKGEYLFLLNNDTFVEEDTFAYLIDTFRQHPRTGVVSPKIRFAFPPRNIQFAGYLPLTAVTLRNQLIGFGEADRGQYNQGALTPYAHGAAMMLKREVIQQVGLMPEIYFLYYEELDWCTHIARAGYELRYDFRCTVYHKESQSTGQLSALRCFYLTRNRLLYAWRNRAGWICMLAMGYQLLVAVPKNSIMQAIKGRMDLVEAILKGTFAFFQLKNKSR